MENNPYAPPVSSIQGTPELVQAAPASGFRDISGLTRNLSILLLIGVGLELLSIGSELVQLNLLSHTLTSQTRAELIINSRRVAFVNLGIVVLYIVTAVVFARWIYFAQRNLPELGARLLRFTPGWAVGCFFVPVLNLWAPCQAMSQLLRASRDPRTWELEDTPLVIFGWWALWLIVQFMGNGLMRSSLGVKTLAGLHQSTELGIAMSVLSAPLYLLAVLIVRRVWRDQSETLRTSHST